MSLVEADLNRSRMPYEAGGHTWATAVSDSERVRRRRVRLKEADASRANLSRILGNQGDFRRTILRQAKLIESDLTDANFTGADLFGTDFPGSNLNGANADAVIDDRRSGVMVSLLRNRMQRHQGPIPTELRV